MPPTTLVRANDMGTDEVGIWLSKLKLDEYILTFKENDIDGRLLIALGEAELESLGIKNPFHKKKLLIGIERLSEASRFTTLVYFF